MYVKSVLFLFNKSGVLAIGKVRCVTIVYVLFCLGDYEVNMNFQSPFQHLIVPLITTSMHPPLYLTL